MSACLNIPIADAHALNLVQVSALLCGLTVHSRVRDWVLFFVLLRLGAATSAQACRSVIGEFWDSLHELAPHASHTQTLTCWVLV
jgi:hypothetical protein